MSPPARVCEMECEFQESRDPKSCTLDIRRESCRKIDCDPVRRRDVGLGDCGLQCGLKREITLTFVELLKGRVRVRMISSQDKRSFPAHLRILKHIYIRQ